MVSQGIEGFPPLYYPRACVAGGVLTHSRPHMLAGRSAYTSVWRVLCAWRNSVGRPDPARLGSCGGNTLKRILLGVLFTLTA